jgi:hypothetical protein
MGRESQNDANREGKDARAFVGSFPSASSTPYGELEKLPEFIQKKMHSSEE